jgi:hypothetical protein
MVRVWSSNRPARLLCNINQLFFLKTKQNKTKQRTNKQTNKQTKTATPIYSITHIVYFRFSPATMCKIRWAVSIGECPSNSPFLKNNGAEAPKGPRPIGFKKWRDTRTFSNLKSTHCTLIILLIINLVTKKFK